MPGPIIRVVAPLVIGAIAGAGAILGATLVRERDQRAIGPAPRPLAHEGWWSSRDSSALAHAHPAVLLVDAETSRLVDSWDRRTWSRVERPVVRRTPEWPHRGVLVVDAVTGDLLGVIETASGAGMPAT